MVVAKYPDGLVEPFYFDSFGQPPPIHVMSFIKKTTNKPLPHNNRDIQSVLNSACGYYCLAFLYYVFTYPNRTHDLYEDANNFLDLFDDLNVSHDFKKNEYILKHFFRSSDPSKRVPVSVLGDTARIINDDEGKGIDPFKASDKHMP